MSEAYDQAWPSELRVSKDKRQLTVSFDDGASFTIPAETMRVLSPSAEVQGHGPGQKVTVPGKRMVEIRNVVPAGNYAVRITFDDGHDSGIFTWRYLRELGEKGDELFAAYETELAAKGMSRDAPGMAR
ncbi:gamma-butyrobetaine hydroxylase-like domain-containing protein [Rhizobium helianthi]|uniref:Gamma-butyrobetaine hydroxylase-like domain-containing protein n=1 Tax=Rhizobium helianthi TaxID=1132695 RepID=A0ABW4LYU6_9HYPH